MSASHIVTTTTITTTAPSPSPVLTLSYETSTTNNQQSTDATQPSNSPTLTSLTLEEIAKYNNVLQKQGENNVKEFFLKKYESESVKNWDRFYRRNADRFYKDRHYLTSVKKMYLIDKTTKEPNVQWLLTVASMLLVTLLRNEFVELHHVLNADRRARGEIVEDSPATESSDSIEDDTDDAAPSASPTTASSSSATSAPPPSLAASASPPPSPFMPIREPTAQPRPEQRRLLEVGCGVGNALFPLLRLHPDLFLYGLDCSRNAIQVVQNHPDYLESNRCGAWVTDLVTEELPEPIRENHLDFAMLVFVLSAIHPDKMDIVLKKIHRALKQNEGVLFIRDYAMYDLAQLRFAKTSKLGSNWYVRQDGTRSYFFTIEELSQLLQNAGFEIISSTCVKKQVINRKEQSEMSRRFIQVRARAVTPSIPSSLHSNVTSSTDSSTPPLATSISSP